MAYVLSRKQLEYISKAKKRWNFKTGAVRAGKSFVDTAHEIPDRILERRDKPGLVVFLGVSKGTIERNVLQPMREHYTSALIGTINSRNIAMVCGEPVYCLGAEKVSQVAKIQGASIKYCYGDEVAKWNKEVFEMLKSRLDKSYSTFDGACNPEDPNHWLKQFLDSDADIYLQEYTIDDNPFLPPEYVENLKKEYAGTIYYDRYILGRWVRAEGTIYLKFANNPKDFYITEIPKLAKIQIGVDFGGNGSKHAFAATGFTTDWNVIPLESKRFDATSPDELDQAFVEFVEMVMTKYHDKLLTFQIRCNMDSAEQVLITGLISAARKHGLPVVIKNALKMQIKDRINLVIRAMGLGLFKINPNGCSSLIQALQQAVWNSDPNHLDERLDDGTTDIDSLDAFEYSIENEYSNIIRVLDYGRRK